MLVDLIAVNDRVMAETAVRLRNSVRKLTDSGNFPPRWQLEIAASLALVGQMSIPPELMLKRRTGQNLSPDERTIIDRAPEAARNLIFNIPRLGTVAEAVYLPNRGYDGTGFPEDGQDARILKILKDLAETEIKTGAPGAEAFAMLEKNASQYDEALLAKIRASLDFPPPAPLTEQEETPATADEHVAPAPAPAPLAAFKAPLPRQIGSAPFLANTRQGGQNKPRKSPVLGRVIAMALALIVVPAIIWGTVVLYPNLGANTERMSEQSGKLVAQMSAAASGWVAPANVFGGNISVNNGTVDVADVPRQACIQASWQLARTGTLVINGVAAQRLTGAIIAKQCLSNDSNTLSWMPRQEH